MVIKHRLCVICTTPLVVNFFLQKHLIGLSKFCDITLITNKNNDSYVKMASLPVQEMDVQIVRQISLKDDLTTLMRLYDIFRNGHFDIVWAVGPKAGLLGMLAAKLARIPRRLFIFQGEVWASRAGFFRWLLKATDRLTAWSATHLLAVSASERQFLEAEKVVPPNTVGVLGSGSICGVDVDRFRPDAAARIATRSELAIPEDALVLIFVGRIGVEKGILELAQAFGQLSEEIPELWLLLVGPNEGVSVAELKNLAAEGSDRLCIVDFTDEPQRYMAAADILCLPSHREGFGMVIIEAGAAGIPAVGSRIYGVSDAIVEGETGLLFDPHDIEALRQAICRLARDPALRHRQGAAARQRATELFDQGRTVQRYIDFMLELLAERGGRQSKETRALLRTRD